MTRPRLRPDRVVHQGLEAKGAALSSTCLEFATQPPTFAFPASLGRSFWDHAVSQPCPRGLSPVIGPAPNQMDNTASEGASPRAIDSVPATDEIEPRLRPELSNLFLLRLSPIPKVLSENVYST